MKLTLNVAHCTGVAAVVFLCPASPITAQDSLRTNRLEEVVVTGTGTQHLLKDAPVQTEVITRRELEQYGGRSLEDILSGLTASFDFNEGDMGAQMQLNGLGNSYILVLVDGKRLHGDVGGENELSLIDPHNIERIEIVKGASSALYGSDAIAGVINIITRKHNEALMVENTTRYGCYNDLRQHNGVSFALGKVKSYTNFQLQHSDGWQNTATEDPRQTEYLITDSRNKTVNAHTNWQLSERLTYEPVKGLELYADGSIYRKRIYRPSGEHKGVDKKFYDLRYNNASAAVGGRWRVNTDDYVTLDIDWNRHAYYYDYTAFTLTEGVVDGYPSHYVPYYPGQAQLQSDQRRVMAHLKGVFALPFENRLSAGFEYRYDWLRAPHRVEGGQATDNTEALYVQDEWSLIPWLNLTGGLRLNRNEQFGFYLTPKFSAMIKVSDLRLRATWSQGFKSPTPKELYYRYVRDMNGTYLYLGNTELHPQVSNYFSFGPEYTWGGLTASVTGYYNKVDKMIALVTIPVSAVPGDLYAQYQPLKTRQYHNLESAKTWGVDVALRYRINKEFAVNAAYSYLDTDAKLYDSEKDELQQVTIDGMAHHKATWSATWNHAISSKRLEENGKKEDSSVGVGLFGRLSSKRYYQLNGDGKGYQLWRLTGNYSFPLRSFLFKLEAGIDNIFDYVDRTPHGLHLGTTSPGRTVYASLTVRFNQGKKLTNNYKSNFKQQNNEED
ncbi:MAG: TonB-dependent receptor [Bacteroidaceae bacterium]|nr:TonB-dependent receptor [Bacteroidaceae bacterium]